MHHMLKTNGRSGSPTIIHIEGKEKNLDPALKEVYTQMYGPLATIDFDFSTAYAEHSDEPDEVEFEYRIHDHLQKKGLPVIQVTKISENKLRYNFTAQPSLAEDLIYINRMKPDRVVKKINDAYELSKKISNTLNEILTEEDKIRIIEKKQQCLRKAEITDEFITNYPITAKILTKTQDPKVRAFLQTIEDRLKPFQKAYSYWDTDNYGENFLGNTKIDMRDISPGVLHAVKAIDTPYLLIDDFWGHISEPHITVMLNYVENGKFNIATSAYADKQEALYVFSNARILFNYRMMLEHHSDAMDTLNEMHVALKNDTDAHKEISQYDMFRVMRNYHQLFAHGQFTIFGAEIANQLDKSTDTHLIGKEINTRLQEVKAAAESLGPQFTEYCNAFSAIRDYYAENRNILNYAPCTSGAVKEIV